MATAKAERLLNLVIALVNSPRFRTAAWIRTHVAGYADAPNDEAFFRTFERDKAELRRSGIALQTPPGDEDGYRIPPVDFALPPVSFTPAEAAALGLAGRLWETTALATAGSGALRKIRDAVSPSPGPSAGPAAPALGEASTLLQPRVRTGDPAFTPLYDAIRGKRAVTFDYRKGTSPASAIESRSVQPWGLVSYRGRWYLVGHDADRDDQRTFRLSRIAGQVRAAGRITTFPPPGHDLLAEVARSVDVPAERTAVVLIQPGRAAGLRRTAVRAEPDPVDGWDRVQIPLGHLWDTARKIAGQGPDVLVESPPDLADAVVRLLSGVEKAVRSGGDAQAEPAAGLMP